MRNRLLAIPAMLGMALCLHVNAHAISLNDIETSVTKRFEEANLGEEARYAAIVIDAETGERLIEINPNVPMKPASTTKMFTAATALNQLGPAHRFYTYLETDGHLDEKGTLVGDLIVRGGGDPGLGPRFQVDKNNVTKVFEDWATELKRLGIRRIEGNVIGDDSFFEDDRWGPEWYYNERGEYYMAEIGALTFNDACIDVTFSGKETNGDHAKITKIAPDFGLYSFESRIRVVEPGQGSSIDLFRHESDSKFAASGTLEKGTERTRWAAVQDPARYTVHTFMTVLEKEGIDVTGTAQSRHRAADADQPNPPAETLLYQHFSAPLSDQLVPILSSSQNMYTETVGRHAAMHSGEPSTFEGATRNITKWLEERNLVQPGFVLFDASGLSPLNRIPPRMLADLLMYMRDQGFEGQLFSDSLARAAERGSMSRYSGPKGRLRGKTGTLGDTNTLGAYLTLTNGKEYVIVLMNDQAKGGGPVIERIANDLDKMLTEWNGGQ